MAGKFLETGPFRRYPPFGRCIYCGAKDDLSDEHIIPFALGGNIVLPKASCPACAKITAQFEQACTRTMMGPLRVRMNLQTRRKKERPQEFSVQILGPCDSEGRIEVPAISYPAVCIGIKLDPPRMVTGQPLTDRVTGELFAKYNPADHGGLVKRGQAAKIGTFKLESFCRMIAKIGHAHVMAALANDGIFPTQSGLFLPDIILGKSPHFQHYVGGDQDRLDEPNALHQLRFNRYNFNGSKILVSTVRLFALFGMPRYHVIVCYEP
jgi:hypothetical protein